MPNHTFFINKKLINVIGGSGTRTLPSSLLISPEAEILTPHATTWRRSVGSDPGSGNLSPSCTLPLFSIFVLRYSHSLLSLSLNKLYIFGLLRFRMEILRCFQFVLFSISRWHCVCVFSPLLDNMIIICMRVYVCVVSLHDVNWRRWSWWLWDDHACVWVS